jgi:hypothetical protein
MTSPCRCAFCLLVGLEYALDLLVSGRTGQAWHALMMLRWRTGAGAAELACDPAAQLKVKKRPRSSTFNDRQNESYWGGTVESLGQAALPTGPVPARARRQN